METKKGNTEAVLEKDWANLSALEEFKTQGTIGQRNLIRGLEKMFGAYFKEKRFYEDENETEAVCEAFHFAMYLFTNRDLIKDEKRKTEFKSLN